MRFFIGLILFVLFVEAKSIEATYKISFGIFGQIGIANARLHVDEQNAKYTIQMHAFTTGFAKALSGERQEWYVSRGEIDKKGIFSPEFFEKKVQRKSRQVSFEKNKTILKEDIKRYIFFHKEKRVIMERVKKRGEQVYEEKKEAKYYAPNDLLSLFFNFKKLFPSLDVKTPLVFYAMGANKKDGRIDIEPLKNPKQVIQEYGWQDGNMMKVVINQEIFASKRGELLVNLGDDGLCQKAVLKDVLFFGDIKGELIEK